MRFAFPLLALVVAVPLMACAASTSPDPVGDAADQGSEQDLSAAKAQLKGSWTIAKDSASFTSTLAIEFRPDGSYWRDEKTESVESRETGRYVINTSAHRITLHIATPEASEEVYSFQYSAASTDGHLVMTAQGAPGSHIAFPALTFDHADSYCTADADCDAERSDGTWTPGRLPAGTGIGPYIPPNSSCDTASRSCAAVLAK